MAVPAPPAGNPRADVGEKMTRRHDFAYLLGDRSTRRGTGFAATRKRSSGRHEQARGSLESSRGALLEKFERCPAPEVP